MRGLLVTVKGRKRGGSKIEKGMLIVFLFVVD